MIKISIHELIHDRSFVHSANLQQMSNQANIPSLTSKDTVQQKSNSAQYSHKIPDNFNTITQHQDGCSYV